MNNLTQAKKIHTVVMISLFLIYKTVVIAQSYDPFLIFDKMKGDGATTKDLLSNVDFLNEAKTPNHYVARISKWQINKWLDISDEVVRTQIKISRSKSLTILLSKSNCTSDDFTVLELNGSLIKSIPLQKSIHLKGHVEGELNSIVSLSIYKNEVYGAMSLEDGTQYSIRSIKEESQNIICQVTNESLQNKSNEFVPCATDDVRHYIDDHSIAHSRSKDNCKIVAISIHTDYALFQKMSLSSEKVSNYILSIFNNVQAIYRKEDIQISIAELLIHTSDDRFPHTSSMVDLEHFRTSYPTYKGNINLLISGFSRNGNPALGGLAYVNSLCMKNYSFAFVNVQGSFSLYPTYSWDVFVCAHELGHVLGSRHTHACVWGPTKKQALDNCAKVEGSCLAGPTPSKGTLMSYCYTSGQPGVDMTLGFGTEPGNLIREKINLASCLSSYIPTNKNVTQSNKHIYANTECFDGTFTHYYFDNNTISPSDDILVMSINKKGQDIGNIANGTLKIAQHTTSSYGNGSANTITAPYVPIGKEFIAANKYWEIIPSKQPSSELICKISFTEQDLTDLKFKNSTLTSQNLLVYSIASPGNPNPESNHERVTNTLFSSYTFNATSAPGKWSLTKDVNGSTTAEFGLTKLNGVGIGYFRNSEDMNYSSFVLNYFKLRLVSAYNYNIEWQTSVEKNTNYFVVERSTNGLKFDSIRVVAAAKNSTIAKTYSLSYFNTTNTSNTYYRLRMVDLNGNSTYSMIVNPSSSYNFSNRVSVYPNPAPIPELSIEFTSSSNTNATIDILDLSGNKVKGYTKTLVSGKNNLSIDISTVNNGFYYLNISTPSESIRQKFSINRT